MGEVAGTQGAIWKLEWLFLEENVVEVIILILYKDEKEKDYCKNVAAGRVGNHTCLLVVWHDMVRTGVVTCKD